MKDHYAVLGVPRSASPAGIRARYRRLARSLHPDVAGAQSTGAFQEIAEAYRVLGDPIARRRYNEQLAAVERRPVVELEGLDFEVILTPGEAAGGVEVPVGVPRVVRCPECGGQGGLWFLPCLSCGARGLVEREDVVRVRIPPVRRPRTLVEVSLPGPGLRDVRLRLHIRIQ